MTLQEQYQDALQAIGVRRNYLQFDRNFSTLERMQIKDNAEKVIEESQKFLSNLEEHIEAAQKNIQKIYLSENASDMAQAHEQQTLETAFNNTAASLLGLPKTIPEIQDLIDVTIDMAAETYKEKTGYKPSVSL